MAHLSHDYVAPPHARHRAHSSDVVSKPLPIWQSDFHRRQHHGALDPNLDRGQLANSTNRRRGAVADSAAATLTSVHLATLLGLAEIIHFGDGKPTGGGSRFRQRTADSLDVYHPDAVGSWRLFSRSMRQFFSVRLPECGELIIHLTDALCANVCGRTHRNSRHDVSFGGRHTDCRSRRMVIAYLVVRRPSPAKRRSTYVESCRRECRGRSWDRLYHRLISSGRCRSSF